MKVGGLAVQDGPGKMLSFQNECSKGLAREPVIWTEPGAQTFWRWG